MKRFSGPPAGAVTPPAVGAAGPHLRWHGGPVGRRYKGSVIFHIAAPADWAAMPPPPVLDVVRDDDGRPLHLVPRA